MQPLDPRVVNKINELVLEGVCNIDEIERSENRYVRHDLFREECQPEASNRRFHPSSKDIRNHFNLAFSKCKLAKQDQKNVSRLVEEWKSNTNVNDNFFFRPYIAGSAATATNSNSSDDNKQQTQSLLFVHQMAWQKRLLLRYGRDICLMDATYKTSKYALPLFFLCVKTNVNYTVVASFITQNEAQSDKEEALQVLKLWNPDWNPSFFVTDNCNAEINAL